MGWEQEKTSWVLWPHHLPKNGFPTSINSKTTPAYAPNKNPSTASTTAGETLWALVDHLGSVRDLVANGGVVREHVVYDSFGNRLVEQDYDTSGVAISSSHAEAVDSLFGYTGRDWDADAGLQYNRARWYDPATGRWLSQDPIGFEAGDANLYRYVGNGATTKTDPSGLQPPATDGPSTTPTDSPMTVDGLPFGRPTYRPGSSRPDIPPGYIPWRDPFTGGESCIGRLQKVPTPPLGYDWHYDRNRFNRPPATEQEAQDLGWILQPPGRSIYHQHGLGRSNRKYLSPDGAMEGVYDKDGNLVTSAANQGTFNYESNDFGHLIYDVIPYWIWGNCEDDPVPVLDRIGGPGTTPSLPPPPSDSDLEDIIEAIIGKPIFPRL